jgi:hypothetical protein
MLKTPFKQNTDLKTNFFVFSEDNASDTDFVFEKILNVESLSNINGIIDFESVEYKPIHDNIEFDIFFLRYLLKDEIEEIKNYVEPAFVDYSDKILALNTSKTTELFDVVNNEGLILPQFDGMIDLTKTEINDSKPYVVTDPNAEFRKKYPKKQGYPHFYNTLVFPFWDKKDVWSELRYGFNNKTYTYNSFLIIDVYDSYDVEKQKRVTTIPIYISDRYVYKEKRETRTYSVFDELGNVIESITTEGAVQKRPVFNLSENIDGYSFFFLKKYTKSEFYVKFYFWDALNGKKIELIPSGKSNNKKKWLQDVETFDQKNLYLKYELDFDNKKYRIFDLNSTTGKFNIELDKIDLYEFAYDDYWSSFFVKNEQPTNVTVVEPVVVYKDILPFKEKIIGPYYLLDTKYLTLKDGFTAQTEAVYPKIDKEWRYVYFGSDEGYQYVLVDYISQGNYYGYFLQKANDIEIKNIGLLNIRDIKCGVTNINGSKRSIESIKLKNVNHDKNFLINNVLLENVVITSNEENVDLSTTATLSYEIQNYPTGSDLYTEFHVLPKTKDKKTFGYYNSLFSDAFELYKTEVETGENQNYNQDIYNKFYQKTFANMCVLDGEVQSNADTSAPDGYTSQNLSSKIITEPSFKEQTIALTASTSSKKLLYDEEMFVSLDVVFGKMALFYCGVIKQINIKATLVINYSELNNQDQTNGKITIPINIDLK